MKKWGLFSHFRDVLWHQLQSQRPVIASQHLDVTATVPVNVVVLTFQKTSALFNRKGSVRETEATLGKQNYAVPKVDD